MKQKGIVSVFTDPMELAGYYAGELVKMINEATKQKRLIRIALSGGSTPELLFSLLGDKYPDSADWKYVHFFWGDERCVAPDNEASNYKMTRISLFDKIAIPFANVHRIKGEDDPEEEALRYSEEISLHTEKANGWPVFDLVILGLGDDGHTASIFPGQLHLIGSDKICEVAAHPLTGQKRITITGQVINNANSVVFLVTGTKKADILDAILNRRSKSMDFPASHVNPVSGNIRWLIDEDAFSLR